METSVEFRCPKCGAVDRAGFDTPGHTFGCKCGWTCDGNDAWKYFRLVTRTPFASRAEQEAAWRKWFR